MIDELDLWKRVRHRQLMSVVDRRVGNTRVSLNTGSSGISEVWEKDTVAVAVRDTVEL